MYLQVCLSIPPYFCLLELRKSTLPSLSRPQTLLPLCYFTQFCLFHLLNLITHLPLRLLTLSNSILSLFLYYIIFTLLIRCNTLLICLLSQNTKRYYQALLPEKLSIMMCLNIKQVTHQAI